MSCKYETDFELTIIPVYQSIRTLSEGGVPDGDPTGSRILVSRLRNIGYISAVEYLPGKEDKTDVSGEVEELLFRVPKDHYSTEVDVVAKTGKRSTK